MTLSTDLDLEEGPCSTFNFSLMKSSLILSGWVFLGLFTDGGTKRAPLPKICHTYSTMMKLGTVIPYLKKIQKTCKSSDTSHKFC